MKIYFISAKGGIRYGVFHFSKLIVADDALSAGEKFKTNHMDNKKNYYITDIKVIEDVK